MRIVLTKTEAAGQRGQGGARRAARAGTRSPRSTRPTRRPRTRAALLNGVTKGQQDAALDKAAFAAPVNKLLGPVKGQFGYYVVEVTKITPATQQTLAQATPLIKQTLTSQLQTPARRRRSTTTPRRTG